MQQLNLFNQPNAIAPKSQIPPQEFPYPTPISKQFASFSNRALAYDSKREWEKRSFNKDIFRTLEHGWMLPCLGGIDAELFGRWEYWGYLQQVPTPLAIKLMSHPLDKVKDDAIEFVNAKPFPLLGFDKDDSVADWLYSLISKISAVGDDSGGWGSIEFFLDWCLFGLGHPRFTSLPDEGNYYQSGNQMLYQCFDLFPLLAHPHDYMGELLASLQSSMTAQTNKFYPTPMSVVQVMTSLTCSDSNLLAKTSEDCCGSGAIALGLSNYFLSGMFRDKSRLFVKATLFQCHLYAPWFARPIWWLEHQSRMAVGNSISDTIDLDYYKN